MKSHKRIDPYHHIPVTDDRTMRQCLQCDVEFPSTESGHRMCVKCRALDYWGEKKPRTDKRWGVDWHTRDNICRVAAGMKPRPARDHPSDRRV